MGAEAAWGSWLTAVGRSFAAAGDLLVPQTCPGCGIPGRLCDECRAQLSVAPVRISPRMTPLAPTWACGTYAGPRREIVIAAKEHGDIAARHAMGAVIAGALNYLIGQGILAHPSITPIVLIPAPTKASAARRRGGDPVTAACTFAAERFERVAVVPILVTAEKAGDSSALGARQRRANISGRVIPKPQFLGRDLGKVLAGHTIVLIDDVITTGATTVESTMVLASVGLRVNSVIGFTCA